MSFTAAPPRRDLYELEQTLSTVQTKSAAEQGGSFLPKTRPPRIGTTEWIHARADTACAVFNGAYGPDGKPLDTYEDPWTVVTPDGEWEYFPTHTEALAYAFKENQ